MKTQILEICKNAKSAAKALAKATTKTKNEALSKIAESLLENKGYIIAENKKDLEYAMEQGVSPAMIDRLTLNDSRIQGIANGLKDVMALPDPVGEVVRMWKRPNGLMVGKKRIPLGVIAMIYEARPNVTVDAGVLCLKSGNAAILRGGKEAFHSSRALAEIMRGAIVDTGLPPHSIQVFPLIEREAVNELLKMEEYVDLVIPRGGEGLIRTVVENSKIPVIKHYKGVCHAFVDESADIEMAVKIISNAKAQRPGVCNALETLLVHSKIKDRFFPPFVEEMKRQKVLIKGCPETLKYSETFEKAAEKDWDTEYLELILSVMVVKDMDEALRHIENHGSYHTETIITQSYENARRFIEEVDASAVMVNASTRFNDGGELGLGAEIGISTTKMHAYGPMGLEELTTTKFIVYGSGQIRA